MKNTEALQSNIARVLADNAIIYSSLRQSFDDTWSLQSLRDIWETSADGQEK